MIDTKKKGRPRKFDREAALDAAVGVFQAEGYDGASMDLLTRAMGINRPSLYGAFGDKQALFLEALARYGETSGAAAVRAFLAGKTPETALTAFFEMMIAGHRAKGDAPGGCLVASCAGTQAGRDAEVAARLRDGQAGFVSCFAERFEAFVAEGALPEGFPSAFRARLVQDMMFGLAFRARMGESAEELAREVPDRVAAILA
ncbi:TetR/AcrR family transcriptional regulator [Pseudaestuariivita sp.]|uniref:TetR/AcrR family transcriptional regulator n=1 Tax=Pseudaestuariivita sp. TaxID=2211669 RepID=UPI004058CE9F